MEYKVTKTVTYEAIIRDADSEDDALQAAQEDESFGGDLFWQVDSEYQVDAIDQDGVVIDA